jgi:hypothetical protein
MQKIREQSDQQKIVFHSASMYIQEVRKGNDEEGGFNTSAA